VGDTHSAHFGLPIEDTSNSKATFSNSGIKVPLPFQPREPPEIIHSQSQIAFCIVPSDARETRNASHLL